MVRMCRKSGQLYMDAQIKSHETYDNNIEKQGQQTLQT